jgi:hypothetical protein
MQTPEGLDIAGSVYLAFSAAVVTGACIPVLAPQDCDGSFNHATFVKFTGSWLFNSVSKRCVKTGLAKHSAITNGSSPSA